MKFQNSGEKKEDPGSFQRKQTEKRFYTKDRNHIFNIGDY